MNSVENRNLQPLDLHGLASVISMERIAWDEPMSKHTSFNIGGPADALVTPANEEELADLLKFCRLANQPYCIIGRGTNLLVRDKGIRGVVIKIDQPLSNIKIEGSHVTAGAGIALGELSRQTGQRGLSGLEFAVGIPGSLGGAVLMNAGAYDGEMKDVIKRVRVIDENGEFKVFTLDQIKYGYRYSIFQGSKMVVLEATVQLIDDDPVAIKSRIDDFTQRREARQPLDLPSAGSVFRRPDGYYVGPMLQELGFKGFRVNDAQVSEVHAGFIVNRGQARAADVLELIAIIQEKVKNQYKVDLLPEIKIIGED